MCGFMITERSANIKMFKWKETWRMRILVEALSGITKFDINPLKAKVFLRYIQNVNLDLTKNRVCKNQKSQSATKCLGKISYLLLEICRIHT
jgi:hypothetical protein